MSEMFGGTGAASPIRQTALIGSGSFEFDRRTKWVRLALFGAGGGGGSGSARAATGTDSVTGGGGGAPGEVVIWEGPVAVFGASAAYACGAGGTGGEAHNINSGSQGGRAGARGGDTTFGPLAASGGPGASQAGNASSTAYGGILTPYRLPPAWIGGGNLLPRGGQSATDAIFEPVPNMVASDKHAGAGGGGGTRNSRGGFGGGVYSLRGGAGGLGSNSGNELPGHGEPGAAGNILGLIPGAGGGGGGAHSGNAGGAGEKFGGQGGNGGLPGGGGGGGGGAQVEGSWRVISGAGGQGGNGAIAVFEFA